MGASLVVRSAGSHGSMDLVGVFPDHIKLVQVKSSKYDLTVKDKVTLSIMPRPDCARIELWVYRARKPFLVEVIG